MPNLSSQDLKDYLCTLLFTMLDCAHEITSVLNVKSKFASALKERGVKVKDINSEIVLTEVSIENVNGVWFYDFKFKLRDNITGDYAQWCHYFLRVVYDPANDEIDFIFQFVEDE